MKKIRYYYSSMSKQVFLILLMLLVAARFFIFQLVIKYDILGKASLYNVPATVAMNTVFVLICIFLLIGYRLFYTKFDEHQVIYRNLLLRKEVSLDLDSLERAVLSKRGIKLYTKGSESPSMFIPFFRMGVISPAGVDEFYRLLKAKDIHIEKQFVTLPGHGKSKKIIPAVYSALALLTLASLTQAVALASAIVKQS